MMDGETMLLVSTLFPGQPAVSGFIKYCDTYRRPYFLKHGAHVYEEGDAHERIWLASSQEIMIQGPGKI